MSADQTVLDRKTHNIESVIFNGENWSMICCCGWECWNRADEDDMWDDYTDHIVDDLRTMVSVLRERTLVTRL